MKKIIVNPLLCASIFNLFLFLNLFFLVKPIYDTEEDVYILYLLSGGFGNSPTELLHYNHGLHPYLGYFIKTLFVLNSNINWYSLCLTTSHYIACTIILYYLLKIKPGWGTLFIYLLLFVVFECMFLININFSNTAIMLGCSGIFLLVAAIENEHVKIKKVICALFILLLASMFRIHVLIPLIIIALPFIFMYKPKRIVVFLLFAIVLISLSNFLQQEYYQSKIPGWRQEENYRQKVYQLYNHKNFKRPARGQRWYTEFELIYNGLAIDTSFLSSKKLDQMYTDVRNVDRELKVSDKNYWFWTNNKISFCIAVFMLTLCLRQKKLLIISLLSLIIIGGIFLVLTIVFSKLPDYIILSTLLLWSLLVLFFRDDFKNSNGYFLAGIVLFLTFWGGIRIHKNNRKNVGEINYFKSAFSEIAKQRQTLFLITGDAFPLQKFYIWNLPKDYLLFNFLGNDHFLNNIYQQVYKQYNITSTKELLYSSNVLFWGDTVPALEQYFSIINQKPIFVSPPLKQFIYGPVYKIKFQN